MLHAALGHNKPLFEVQTWHNKPVYSTKSSYPSYSDWKCAEGSDAQDEVIIWNRLVLNRTFNFNFNGLYGTCRHGNFTAECPMIWRSRKYIYILMLESSLRRDRASWKKKRQEIFERVKGQILKLSIRTYASVTKTHNGMKLLQWTGLYMTSQKTF